MKNLLYSLCTLLAFLFFVSCEGPAGLDGQDGADGVDGVDGQDGTAVCIGCHNNTTNELVTAGYEVSTHGTSAIQWNGSTTVEYAGSRSYCAKCHSNEGFIETQFTGLDVTAVDPVFPQNIQCETCHDFHATLDFENEGPDYAIRSEAVPVVLDIDETVTLDFGDNSNLCVNCHQPRTAAPTDDGTGNFAITNTHYGPHHSPQATMLEGMGAYEFTGSSYPTEATTHRTMSSCTSCHMTGDPADHDFTPDVTACTECHTDAADFDINGAVTEVETLLATLEGHLITAGFLDADGHALTGTFPIDQSGAYYNYKLVEEDQSGGIHNPAYSKAILEASIAVFAP